MGEKYWMITGFGNCYETSAYEFDTKEEMMYEYESIGKYSSSVKLIRGTELVLDAKEKE